MYAGSGEDGDADGVRAHKHRLQKGVTTTFTNNLATLLMNVCCHSMFADVCARPLKQILDVLLEKEYIERETSAQGPAAYLYVA